MVKSRVEVERMTEAKLWSAAITASCEMAMLISSGDGSKDLRAAFIRFDAIVTELRQRARQGRLGV